MKTRYIPTYLLIFFLLTVSLCAQKTLESPFAINGMGYFHIKNDPNIWKIGEDRAKLIDDLGASFDRSDFWWGYIEPKKGEFDWSFPDAVVADYKKHKFRIFPILNYFSAWSGNKAPNTDEERELFGRYVFMVVSRYKKDIRYWEVWNEPNLSTFWAPNPNPENYAKLLKVVYKAAKAADPHCTIVAPALAGADKNFMEEMYKHGAKGNYDVFSYHYYRTDPPEKNREVAKDIQGVYDFLKKHDDIKPIWITEFGVQSYEGALGVSEEEQAKLLVRNYMELLATGKVDRVFWFCLQDWTDDPKSPPWDAHLGLARRNLEPKPSYYAYKTMTEKLTGKKFVGEIKTQKDVYQYVFADATSSVMVAWTTQSTASIKVRDPFSVSQLNITDLKGEKLKLLVPYKESYGTYTVSESPIYIENLDSQDIQKANFHINPWLLEIPRGIPTSASIQITNVQDSTIQGTIRLIPPSGWSIDTNLISYSLKSGESGSFPIKIQTGVRTDTGSYLIKVADTTSRLFDGLGKEVYVTSPLNISFQIPSSFSNKNESAFKVNLENLTAQELKGNLSLHLSDLTQVSAKPEPFTLNSGEKKAISFIPNSSIRIPPSFNGRFSITLSANGQIQTEMTPVPLDKNEDITFFPIHKLKNPIKIDGDLSDWKDIQPLMDEGSQILLKLDPKGFGGKEDLSAKVYLAWDKDNLYVAADVTDDKLVLPQNDSVWDYDSLQLAIDPLNDANKEIGGFDNDDYEFEVGLMDKGPHISMGTVPLYNKINPAKVVQCQVVKKADGKGLIYELAIPNVMIPELQFKSGSCFAFCALENDNDGQGRKGWVESTPGIGLGKNPGEYIRILLTD